MELVLLEMLDQRAAGAVDDALGHAGGAGGIHDVERMVEGQTDERRLGVRVVRARLGDDVLDLARQGHPHQVVDGLDGVSDGLRPFAHVEVLAAIFVAVAGDQHLGFDLAETVERALDAEVRGTRRPDRAEAGGGQHGDDGLGNVG